MVDWIEFWHWWALGVFLILLEILAPGFIIMWVGMAAIAVGFVLLVFPGMGWQFQLLLFGVFSVISIYVSWKYLRKNKIETDEPKLRWPCSWGGIEMTEGRRTITDEQYVALGAIESRDEYIASLRNLIGLDIST